MKKFIFLCLSLLLVACSNNNHIESDLKGATDSYLDVNKIYHCTLDFSVTEDSNNLLEITDDMYSDSFFKNSILSKNLQKNGFLVQKNNKFYFTDKTKNFFKFDRSESGIKKVHFCNGVYKVTDILNIPEYAVNNPQKMSASFKSKIDYFDWYNDDYTDEKDRKLTSDMTNSFTFNAIYKKTATGWEILKINDFTLDKDSFSKSFEQIKKLDEYHDLNEINFEKYFKINLKNNFGLEDR